jgi:hypothetical protein
MAKRRRSRGLGSPDTRDKLARIVDLVHTEAISAQDHLSRGDCGASIRALVRSALAVGRAEPHITAGTVSIVAAAHDLVSSTRRLVASTCRIR